jgi:hypothetical protein
MNVLKINGWFGGNNCPKCGLLVPFGICPFCTKP